MSTEQFIILLASVEAIAVFVLSFTKVSRGWKTILFILFLGIVFCSSTLKLSHVKEKESQEAAQKTKIDQIDTHVKASLTFQDYIEAARMNRQAGRIDEAIYDVKCALKMNPKSAPALNLLAVLYSDKGDYDSEIETYTKIKKGLADSTLTYINTAEYIYHRNFGRAYIRKNRWTEAKDELRQCLSLNDNCLTCYLDLAKTLDRLKEWQELYDVCKKGIAKFPSSAPLYNLLGEACVVTSRLGEAELVLLKAVEADSTFGQPYLFLGVIYSIAKELEKSARFVDKALELDPTLATDIEILKQKKLLQ
jgi:tetratricopeptide (TPR) repeat protein